MIVFVGRDQLFLIPVKLFFYLAWNARLSQLLVGFASASAPSVLRMARTHCFLFSLLFEVRVDRHLQDHCLFIAGLRATLCVLLLTHEH